MTTLTNLEKDNQIDTKKNLGTKLKLCEIFKVQKYSLAYHFKFYYIAITI
jgi:DNA-binding XRE family transcriptional regulator